MTISTEDYLKGIYQIKHDHMKKVSATALAQRLTISNAAITDMAKKLAEKGLIIYEKYKEIRLTPEGEKAALKVIRRHRLWELFLSRVLDLPLNIIHREAELLEHQTSDFLTDKIDEFLGRPDFDPHGDPIPDSSGKIKESSSLILTNAEKGKNYRITRIRHGDEELDWFFEENEIEIGDQLVVEKVFQKKNSIALKTKGRAFIFNREISDSIYVKEIN